MTGLVVQDGPVHPDDEGALMAAVKPIPDNYPRVTAYLAIDGAGDAIEFYKKIFGALERFRMPGPDGRIGHAEIQLGDSVIMMADAFPEMGVVDPKKLGGTPVTLTVYGEDVADDVRRRSRRTRRRSGRRCPA